MSLAHKSSGRLEKSFETDTAFQVVLKAIQERSPYQIYVVDAILSSIYIISSTITMKRKYIFSRAGAARALQASSRRKSHGRCVGVEWADSLL